MRIRSSRPCHSACRRAERGHHLVDGPRVAHRRAADLLGQIGRQPLEEPLVRLVDVDVLVATDQAERRAHAGVLVRAQGRGASEVLHARAPVVHVDRRGLPALDGVDEPPQDPGVQILLVDGAGRRLDEDVRPLEDELVQAGPDRELRVVMAVDEPRHHEVRRRSEHAVEGPLLLEVGARTRRHDRAALDDERAVGDQRLRAERDDRVPEDQRATGILGACHLRLRWARPCGRGRSGTPRSRDAGPRARRSS